MRANPSDVVDLFVYVVVLNLAIEYVPSVISEGFTLSLLTAALLKVALEVVLRVKNKVLAPTTRRDHARAPSSWPPCRCGWSLSAASSSFSNW